MGEAAASMAHDDMESIEPDRLGRFCQSVFEALGMDADDAAVLAQYFVWTELRGLPYVGARRIPEFVRRLRNGGTSLPRNGGVTIVHERDAFVLVDAEHTFAQLSGTRAMRMALEKARGAGVGIAVVRNTTSAGNLGYYAMLAAEQGMIGMAINNTAPVMAAWGGAAGVMGSQPFAVASPAGDHPAPLLDMTNSAMSMVRMYEHQVRGDTIPDGIAFDAAGQPTNDPAAAIAGILLPSSHRGYGLALMLEILTGVLAGGDRFGGNVGHPARHAEPMGVTLFLMAIDPASTIGREAFAARVDAFIDHVTASPTVRDGERVRVPGERSEALARARSDGGIPMPADVIQALTALGAELRVTW